MNDSKEYYVQIFWWIRWNSRQLKVCPKLNKKMNDSNSYSFIQLFLWSVGRDLQLISGQKIILDLNDCKYSCVRLFWWLWRTALYLEIGERYKLEMNDSNHSSVRAFSWSGGKIWNCYESRRSHEKWRFLQEF